MIFFGLLLLLVLVFLIFISHLNSVLEIFVETLWYRAYIDNKGEINSSESNLESEHKEKSHGEHNDHSHEGHH